MMAAPIGNEFYKKRTRHGRKKLFESPKALLEAAFEYFKWCDDNPLEEEKVFHYKGQITRTEICKLRAYTLKGLCNYLKCSENYFIQFKAADRKDKEAFVRVIKEIESIIYDQKFTGAAAGFLNPNIIARDLGLVDKKETKQSGKLVITKSEGIELPDNGEKVD